MGCQQSMGLARPMLQNMQHNRTNIHQLFPVQILDQRERYALLGKTYPPVQEQWPPRIRNPIVQDTNTNIAMSRPDLANISRGPPKDQTIVFVLGGPGCGKGTQCERIVRDFGFLHISTGELLRDEVKKGTPIGKTCERLMKEGKLVPIEITLELLQHAMRTSGKTKFLIDGFPRAVDQAQAFESKLGRPDKVLFLECPKETMEERLLKRGQTSGRADDTPMTILKRFDTFERESLPVKNYYENIDSRILTKVSSVPPPDVVYKEILGSLKNIPGLKTLA